MKTGSQKIHKLRALLANRGSREHPELTSSQRYSENAGGCHRPTSLRLHVLLRGREAYGEEGLLEQAVVNQ